MTFFFFDMNRRIDVLRDDAKALNVRDAEFIGTERFI